MPRAEWWTCPDCERKFLYPSSEALRRILFIYIKVHVMEHIYKDDIVKET